VPHSRPSPHWGAEENRKNRQILVGWDKGSLTEQQTKGTVTTTIQKRGIQNTNSRTKRADLTARCHWALSSCE